ncbi:hypothetical protein SAMN05444128_1151 [Pontibacter indicus]|uniref:Uncharacterized protein n=1 Tax=Pontibacter indicus TaxID=1317125 RepID=A0A1R3WYN3_9BACT|nr:hypothetical protein SAMN05444128_1151 [Pontibacter indicus]
MSIANFSRNNFLKIQNGSYEIIQNSTYLNTIHYTFFNVVYTS